MTPERMERIGEVLEKALTLDPRRRGEYLDALCASDSELRREVESLLDSHERAGSSFLNAPAVSVGEGTAHSSIQPRRRIGAYDILEQIGHGGMGEVFSAVRADGQYEKKVAIKLVRSGYDTEFILERFRNERQILASLDHPNIARLLDGGTTEEGVPYLVMELVEGAPIDDHCDSRKLNITSRLQLFREACGAVQYAHQRLVIHRDLKPSNILVTPESSPKLLDFGIAKLLDSSGSTEATVLRPMTPEYASPEQIRGETITTATDVYSMGVVLYQLLTGHSPYRLDTRKPADLAEAITHDEPERPSISVQKTVNLSYAGPPHDLSPENVSSTREGSPFRLQQRLQGDLDFILLKALRKEPDKRYSSVEQFSEDIRRHLEGLPITARKGTWNYRAGKFIRRHRAGVVAAALLFATFLTGVTLVVREAHIAEANRRRAEARFNDVRKLANSLIFEVNDSIANFPGATQARKLILQRALEYLDSLSKEAGNEPDLQRELATAYSRIGSLQGNPMDPNLGDTKAALASFQKSMALRESLARSNPANNKDQVELAVAYLDYAEFQSQGARNPAAALEFIRKAVAILDREAAAAPSDLRTLLQAYRAYSNLGFLRVGNGLSGTVGTIAEGVAALHKALIFNQRVIGLAPANVTARGQEAVINMTLADGMVKLGDRPHSLEYNYRAMEILNALNSKGDNIRIAVNSVVVMGRIADVLLMEGRTEEAIGWFTKTERRAARLAAIDSHDEVAQRLVITSSAQLGHALVEAGRFEEGLRYMRKASATAEAVPGHTPLVEIFKAQLHLWFGETAERKGKLREASQEYAKGKIILGAVRAATTNDMRTQVYFSNATDSLAAALLKLGKPVEAGKEYGESLALVEPLSQANPDNMEVLYALAETYTGEGDVAAKLAAGDANNSQKMTNWTASRDWYRKSQDIWSRVPNPSRLSTSLMEVTVPSEVARRLAACNARISSLASRVTVTSPAKK